MDGRFYFLRPVAWLATHHGPVAWLKFAGWRGLRRGLSGVADRRSRTRRNHDPSIRKTSPYYLSFRHGWPVRRAFHPQGTLLKIRNVLRVSPLREQGRDFVLSKPLVRNKGSLFLAAGKRIRTPDFASGACEEDHPPVGGCLSKNHPHPLMLRQGYAMTGR